ncbi:hypothetical protein EO087_06045 [Dyella sp. M7H15-1]|uniref:hypothetical protein n=1 Tax=Dyella sp. M7H15-1 TaxID=2501295 RepID=UPI001004E64F|nr:hypothetical protein [Dyella sp. M7H15-1]QAU23597.1 hypothetical protein EO087_06045 [Dyella sp. M7H15-1]
MIGNVQQKFMNNYATENYENKSSTINIGNVSHTYSNGCDLKAILLRHSPNPLAVDAVNGMDDSHLEEMASGLVASGNLSVKNMYARCISLHTMAILNNNSSYNVDSDLYMLHGNRWAVIETCTDNETNKIVKTDNIRNKEQGGKQVEKKIGKQVRARGRKTEKKAPVAPKDGLAFWTNSGDVDCALKDVISNRSKNTLDCSLAKQLSYMSGYVNSQDVHAVREKGEKFAVYNESISIDQNDFVTFNDFTEDLIVNNNNLLIPGDAVYFENHEDYPIGPAYLLSGHHAIYVGKNNEGERIFSAFGIDPMKEDDILDMMDSAYIRDYADANNCKENEVDITGGFPRLSTIVTRFKLA